MHFFLAYPPARKTIIKMERIMTASFLAKSIGFFVKPIGIGISKQQPTEKVTAQTDSRIRFTNWFRFSRISCTAYNHISNKNNPLNIMYPSTNHTKSIDTLSLHFLFSFYQHKRTSMICMIFVWLIAKYERPPFLINLQQSPDSSYMEV